MTNMTRLTFSMDVPLSEDDIRKLVHLIDEGNSGPGEGIKESAVKASDYLALYFFGEVQDVTATLMASPEGGITESNVVTDTMEPVYGEGENRWTDS